MNKLLILTYANFPNGEAASVRIYSLSKLFMKLGYTISIISMSRTKPYIWNKYDEIEYISIRSEYNDLIHRFGNVLLYKSRAKKIIKKMQGIKAIMPLSLTLSALFFCESYAKKNSVLLLTDRTEWYSPCEFKFGRLSREYMINAITNRIIIDRYWRVISISRFFEDYFKGKGIKTVRIPALMDTSSLPINTCTPNSIRKIVYAGSPAKKDSLNLIIQGFLMLDSELSKKIELHIYGVSKSFYRKFQFNKNIPNNIYFYGRVSRSEVIDALLNADFSTLLRDDSKRFTKAGFPSKIAESMSVGVPVITNFTSDLDLYLKDEENSLIVSDYSVESFVNTLKRAARKTDEEINIMRNAARLTAEKSFDFNIYLSTLYELQEGDINGTRKI